MRIVGYELELADHIDLLVKKPNAQYAQKIAFSVRHGSLHAHFHSSLILREGLVFLQPVEVAPEASSGKLAI